MKYYTWKEINEDWGKEIFNSIDECIEDARLEEVSGNIYISEVTPYEYYIDARDILEDIENVAYEDFDIHFEFCIDEKVNKLSEELTNVLSKWLKETGQEPNFYIIKEDTIKLVKMENVQK